MMLNVHSYFSLRYGTLSLEDLVEGLLASGHDTAVLTDINNSSGSLDFLRLGMKAGLNVLGGMEFRNGDRLLYIGIARNNEGFRQLNELMTAANKDATALPEVAPDLEQVYFIYPYGSRSVKELRENEYIGIRPAERNLIRLEAAVNWERYVILAPVSFVPEDYKLHCQLRAIDHNILFSQLDKQMVADKEEVLLAKVKLLELYRDFPMLIRNTNRLLASCSFDLDFKKMKNNG